MDKENLFVSSNQVEQETKRKVVFTSSNATFMVLDNKSLYQNSTLSSAENRMNSNASSIPAIPPFRTVALSLRLDKNISMSPNKHIEKNVMKGLSKIPLEFSDKKFKPYDYQIKAAWNIVRFKFSILEIATSSGKL